MDSGTPPRLFFCWLPATKVHVHMQETDGDGRSAADFLQNYETTNPVTGQPVKISGARRK